MTIVTPAQMRAARAMLDWSMANLAEAARLSVSTVKRFENGDSPPVSDGMVAMMQNAAEMAGVRFLDDDGDGIGLRFHHG